MSVTFTDTVESHCELNGLLYSGGVQLTINGKNLKLVERPLMNVSVIISYSGELNHTYTLTVRKLSVLTCHAATVMAIVQCPLADNNMPNNENTPSVSALCRAKSSHS